MTILQTVKDYLYPGSQTIAAKARRYDKTPWYAAPRFAPFAVWVFGMVLTEVLKQNDAFGTFSAIGGLLSVAFPLLYLGAKGYRWILLLEALQIASGQIAAAEWSGYGMTAWNLFVAALFIAPVITAFRIENYRFANGLAPKRKHFADAVKAFVLFALVVGAIVFHGHVQAEREFAASKDLMAEYVFISRHTEDISAFCRKYGVELKKYPRRFKQDYAAKIAEVDRQIAGKRYIKGGLDKILREKRAARVDEMFEQDRQAVIIMKLKKRKGSDNGRFVWKEEYDALMSKSAYCRFVDEHYDWMKSLGIFRIMER